MAPGPRSLRMPAAAARINGVLGYTPGSVWRDELVWGNRLAGNRVAEALVLFPRPTPPAAAPAAWPEAASSSASSAASARTRSGGQPSDGAAAHASAARANVLAERGDEVKGV